MTGGKIAEVLPDDAAGDGELSLSADIEEAVPAEVFEAAAPEPMLPRFRWLPPFLALLAVVAWFGGMLWAAVPALASPLSPLALVEFVGALCAPPALLGIVYMLMLRTSTAEARRFGATARAMRAEAASLERVVATLSRKIEENRLALAEQTTLLIAMGDRASEQMRAASATIAKDARAIDASTRTLSEASHGAEKSVEIVLASLPRAHEEMRAMAATVDSAGLKASEHAAALDVQLSALAERGREADTVAGGAAQRLAAHLARMEATSETAGVRLEQVTAEMSTAVDGVLDRAAEAVDEARKGIATQGEAILAMLSANQAALDRAGRDSADALGERIAAIEEAIGRISVRLAEEQARGDLLVSGLVTGAERTDSAFSALHRQGMERTQALAASLSALGGSFEAMGAAMDSGEERARAVIRTSEDLLTALDAATREIDETLPDALARLDERIGVSRKVIASAKPELLALVTAAESTHDAIEAIADVVAAQRDTLAKTSEALIDTLDGGRMRADELEQIVDGTIATTRRFAEEAAPRLVEVLRHVREAAATAADQARSVLESVVPDAADRMEQAGAAALGRAIDGSVRRQLAELAETTEAAVHAAARASERLTQQMLSIADTTAQVEARIDAAKADREAADRDHFARRVSLLIEALNSASIDITRAFSHEVTDSAWAAYLKGDRGVFTRRAVRLLDAGDAREIARLYDEDTAFRDQVNRYIHDFEAMLRQILALRDGSPLGVTLLSSDMGKLYVALAQAIERLRA